MDFTWFALDCSIWTNPKIAKLAGMLNVDIDAAVCKIARIWSWAMLSENEDGEVTYIPDDELAGIARWKKKPSVLVSALNECGFIDDVDGRKFLHGWASANGKYPRRKREDRERKTVGNSTEIPRSKHGKVCDTVTYTNTINIPSISPKGDCADDIAEIVRYLNEKAGSNFRASTANTRKQIGARLKDGFTVDDCKRVIDDRCKRWKGTEQEQYLRPDTLFRPSKFEGYLNAAPKDTTDDWRKGYNFYSEAQV